MEVRSNMNILKVADEEELAAKTASLFVRAAKDAIEKYGVFRAAISGGSTPRGFFQKLSQPETHSQIPWEFVHLFWVDERCVPPSSEASNFGLATHTFLLDVPIPGQNVHRVEGESDDYEQAVMRYENIIRSVFNILPGQFPQFDMIILGMGSDGHIASILPNTFAQFDTEELVRVVYRMDGDYNRITLTVPVLRAASRLLVLVSGANKAEIVHEVFNSEPDPVRFPVHTLWPVLNKVVWLMDEAACTMLHPSG